MMRRSPPSRGAGAAEQEQIVTIPTLVRKLPRPVRGLIGDLAEISRVLSSIGFVVKNSEMPLTS